MYKAFKRLAIEYGDKEAYAIELLKLLPQPLRKARVVELLPYCVWAVEASRGANCAMAMAVPPAHLC